MNQYKSKSSYPVQMVVRASRNAISNHNKKSSKYEFSRMLNLLPTPLDYYAKELKRFYPKKSQATAQCPFHRDRNPTFSVNLKTGAYLCFACGECGKSIISFHMKKYRLTKQEALKSLGV